MTVVHPAAYSVTCNGRTAKDLPCLNQWPPPGFEREPSASLARSHARAEGWTTRRRDSDNNGLLDFCPGPCR